MLAGNLKTNNFKGVSICQIVVVVAAGMDMGMGMGMGMEAAGRLPRGGNWWSSWRKPTAALCVSDRSPVAALPPIARGAAPPSY